MIEVRILVEDEDRPIDVGASVRALQEIVNRAVAASDTAKAGEVICRLSLSSARVRGSGVGVGVDLEAIWQLREWVVYQEDAKPSE